MFTPRHRHLSGSAAADIEILQILWEGSSLETTERTFFGGLFSISHAWWIIFRFHCNKNPRECDELEKCYPIFWLWMLEEEGSSERHCYSIVVPALKIQIGLDLRETGTKLRFEIHSSGQGVEISFNWTSMRIVIYWLHSQFSIDFPISQPAPDNLSSRDVF